MKGIQVGMYCMHSCKGALQSNNKKTYNLLYNTSYIIMYMPH